MEMNGKAPDCSESSPLLPVSNNPNPNPYVPQSMKSHYISTFSLVQLFSLTVTFGTLLSLPYIFTSMSLVPRTPNFQLDSLFVSKFNVSNTTLGANWDMTLKIENPNLFSSVRFNGVKVSILFKHNNSLAMYSMEPFELGYKEHRMVHMKISSGQTVVNDWVLDEINRQRGENGAVNFSMNMFVWATYTTAGWWETEKTVLKPQCLDLRVGFLPKTGLGSWVNGGPMKCSVPIL